MVIGLSQTVFERGLPEEVVDEKKKRDPQKCS